MAMQVPKASASLLSRVLKDYRKEHKLTQEQLATVLHVEPRTLRAWENERPLENIRELRRIADLLGIELERMGLATSAFVPRTPQEIEDVLKHAWELMHEPRVSEARAVIEKLVRDTQNQITSEDHPLLRLLARIHHAAGYITSMSVATRDIAIPISQYRQLEEIARIIHDDTLLNIALAYQGDMLRRSGNVRVAVEYLEAARDKTPLADASARGNTLQLLGRSYFLTKNQRGFERALREAEELAYVINPETDSTRGRYDQATVYEEYAKSYGLSEQMQKAFDYLEKAEALQPPDRNRETLLMIARAEIFIYNGDISNGKPLAVEAAKISQRQGHQRRLERIYAMKRHLSKKILEYGKAEMELSEILDGPVERWEMEGE